MVDEAQPCSFPPLPHAQWPTIHGRVDGRPTSHSHHAAWFGSSPSRNTNLTGNHAAYAFAESDPHCALGFAPAAQGDLVPVFQEASLFARRQRDRLLASAADLEQRTSALRAVCRKSACS